MQIETSFVEAAQVRPMFELDVEQMENVSGGLVPLAIALGVVVTHVPEITSFFDGFFQAL